MPAQRIRGNDINILLTTDGVLEDTITDVQNFEFSAEFEIKKVGYLGERTERRDYRFMGLKGNMTLHMHAAAYFIFLDNVKKKGQRVLPDLLFNASGLFAFPNGDEVELTIPDMVFGEISHTVASQGEYLTVKVPFECEDFVTTVSAAA